MKFTLPYILCLLLVCLWFVGSMDGPAIAVPACPEPVTLAQPDGTQITIFLKGDERLHWNEDKEGFAVTRHPKNQKLWVYAREVNGKLNPTEHAVGKANPKALRLAKPDVKRMASTIDPSFAPAVSETIALAPISGTLRNLVILVNFKHPTGSLADPRYTIQQTRQQFDDLFNMIGYTAESAVGSVKDYYLEVSRGSFTLESTVVEAVTLDNGYDYYGANDGTGHDLRPQEMVKESLDKLQARGFNFATIDGDGDGWIDGLTIIHAGGGEEYGDNEADFIWSHQWSLDRYYSYDQKKAQEYHTEPANRGSVTATSTPAITRIGVICHEHGHFLDLPDLYDTDGGSKGVGDFCLMAGGSWNGSLGVKPAHMSAWCKAELGWVTPTVISSAGSYSLSAVKNTGQVYKLQGIFPSSQYFLVENRQGLGFDSGLPGSSRGILIWHIDTSVSDNTNPARYKVDLEEASGTQHLELDQNEGDDSDYFRSTNATKFGQTTTPNDKNYVGSWLGLNITSVSGSDSTMTFYLDNGTLPAAGFSPGGGTYASAQNVSMNCPASDATIRYTTNGVDPVDTSPAYTGPVFVNSNVTLKARAFLNGWTASGTTSAVYTILSPDRLISEAKALANGASVSCRSVVVSAVFGTGVFYIEEPDRSSGIRVQLANHGRVVGNHVDVSGTMSSTVEGERFIQAVSAALAAGSGSVNPLAMNNFTLVGGDYLYNSTPPVSGQIGISGASGLNNVGLLVKTWGRVVHRAGNGSYVDIDDGSGAIVRVALIGQTLPLTKNPQVNQYIVVTGIAGITFDGAPLRLIRPRSDSDIQ